MFRIYLAHLSQALSKRWILCVLGALLIWLLAALGLQGSYPPGETSMIMLAAASSSSGYSYLLLLILPIIPYGTSFSSDEQSKALLYWCIRSGSDRYTASKVLAAAISGFLTYFLSQILFYLIVSFWYPITLHGSEQYLSFSVYLESGKFISYFFLSVSYLAFSGSIVAVCGLMMSSFVSSPYIAVATPLTLHLFLTRIISLRQMDVLSLLNPINWHSTSAVDNVYPFLSWIEKAGLTLALCVLMGIIMSEQVKRRLSRA